MGKTFVLRQKALLSSKEITLNFHSDNEVVIPMIVYDKLGKGEVPKERKTTANAVLKYLEKIPKSELMDINKGYLQKNGSRLYLLNPISSKISDEVKKLSGINDYDKQIFQLCLDLTKQGKDVYLISKSPYLRGKADILGIKAEPFKDELAPELKDQYTGKGGTLVVSQESFEKLYDDSDEEGFAINEIIKKPENLTFVENMFFKVTTTDYHEYGVDKYILGRYEHGKIVPLKYLKEAKKKGLKIKPKNDDQKMLMECLLAPPDVAPLVVIKGKAGAGKTYCALATALSNLYSNDPECKYASSSGIYERIVVAAPMIDMENIGSLPGDLASKMGPYIQGVTDNIRNYFKNISDSRDVEEASKKTAELFFSNLLELAPATYMRGRSLENTFAIIDEAQNYNPDLILDITTRPTEGTKLVYLGDPTQIINPGCNSRYNGLVYASETMKGETVTWQVTLNATVRGSLAEAAIRRMKK